MTGRLSQRVAWFPRRHYVHSISIGAEAARTLKARHGRVGSGISGRAFSTGFPQYILCGYFMLSGAPVVMHEFPLTNESRCVA